MSSNLIVPVAADKPEYSNKLPYVFALGEDGIIVSNLYWDFPWIDLIIFILLFFANMMIFFI